ncbi:class I SAM-dependent methyltransferase [Plastoroseomonas arctica]|uniref:class I SAM-dependent methyltransferase n=1 Tax=Plastoroseomonas arctica TaxID=1509237 RepID=UPI0034637948
MAAYYARQDPYGDFVTAPEISQAFGECLGVWSAVVWEGMGRPDPLVWAELGPGRGTLMSDARRAVAQVAPDFARAARVHLVEASARLRAEQAARLGGDVTWRDGVAGLPAGPAVVLANEFFDALPVRQFVRRGAGWVERFVADGVFVERGSEVALGDAPEGAVREVGEAGADVVRALMRRGGCVALMLDYGPAESGVGESLQAMRGGEAVDPLVAPGDADVTAHVDFAALAEAARGVGAAAHGPLPQGVFLQRLGLASRAAMLARADPAGAGRQLAAAQRLLAPEAMGRLFKALALCDAALPTPPGFDA